MSALSNFLSRDALAAAVVAIVMASPASAAQKHPVPAKAPAAATVAKVPRQDPLRLHVTTKQREDEERLVGLRKAYDGLVATRDSLHEGTRACMADQRWLLMKVRDSFYDDGGTPSQGYLDGTVEHLRRSVLTRRGQLAASRAAAAAPQAERDPATPPSREAQRAERSDMDRLNASVDRLHNLRSSCLDWSERTVERVSSVIGAPAASRLERLREAKAVAERDYVAMQGISPDSAEDALMTLGGSTEGAKIRIGSL